MPTSQDRLNYEHLIPLTAGPRELEPVARAAGRPTPRYRRLYGMVIDGDLPAVQIGKFWYFERKNLSIIIEKLGLTPASPVKSSKSRKSAASVIVSSAL